jgi:hypothetical protein
MPTPTRAHGPDLRTTLFEITDADRGDFYIRASIRTLPPSAGLLSGPANRQWR